MLLKLFQNIGDGGTLPNSFYEATITLIPKPDKLSQRKKTTGQLSLMNIGVKSSTKS